MIRINRFVAACTAYSRRQAEAFVRRGDVKINGRVIRDLATYVDIKDVVTLHDRVLKPLRQVYYLVNKPIGVTCSTKDDHAEKLVTTLVPADPPVFPVGRLDKRSHGLILLTNDGELAQSIAHPHHHIDKEYLVRLDKAIRQIDKDSLLSGITIEGRRLKFDSLAGIGDCRYQVIIHQGVKRQIRSMLAYLGYEVVDLQRVRIGGLSLSDIPLGGYRQFSQQKIKQIIDHVATS